MSIIGNKVTLTVKDKEFKGIEQLVENISNFGMEIEDEIESATVTDASMLLDSLTQKYEEYLDIYGSKSQGSRIDDVELDASKIRLNKRGSQWTGAPMAYVTKNKKGCNVTLYGKDILYHEFGTGTVGRDDDYPFDKLKVNFNLTAPAWNYGSGLKIITNGHYKNVSSLENSVPAWYKKAVANHIISESAEVWMSPVYITEGNYAGKFMYNTLVEYKDQLDGSVIPKLGKKSLTLMTKKKITKNL